MEHHLFHYPPRTNQRPDKPGVYRGPTKEHPKVLGLGLEWFVPGFFLLSALVTVEWLMGLAFWEIALSSGFILTYSIVMFWVVHDSFHMRGHWLMRNRFTKAWYARMRIAHDRHHHMVDEDGVIRANYGISTTMCDRVFGTYREAQHFRERGGVSQASILKANQHLKDLRDSA
jgi:hypothetical protein